MLIQSAFRTTARVLPRPKTTEGRSGLSYEKKFVEALRKTLSGPKQEVVIEHNSWFIYKTLDAEKICCPDVIIVDLENAFAIIIEVKQTFVPNALEKLCDLYCPVVSRALKIPTKPLVVCRSLAPGGPNPSSRIAFALTSEYPLYQWLGTGPVLF
jgi:hypothetical protein